MISILKFPSLIKEFYRKGLFNLYYKCYEIEYIKLDFHNFYKNIIRPIKRKNQLRGCNRYD